MDLLLRSLTAARLSGCCCLQLTSEYLPALDLQGLTQLENLYLESDDHDCLVWALFPAQLLRLEVWTGDLHKATWRSLSKCRHLQEFSGQVVDLPVMPAEALPRLQKLMLAVNGVESITWAATVASRSMEACLRLHVNPISLTQPRFHGLQLEELEIDYNVECTTDHWQNLRVRELKVRNFQGGCISGDLLPLGVVDCLIRAATSSRALSVDLSKHGSLQKLCLWVRSSVKLELHGSFQEESHEEWQEGTLHRWRILRWLGPSRFMSA